MTGRKTVGTAEHISVALVTFGAHRLWISLWTHLGQCEDNAASPGVTTRHPVEKGRPSTAVPRRATAGAQALWPHKVTLGWEIADCPQDPLPLRRLLVSL